MKPRRSPDLPSATLLPGVALFLVATLVACAGPDRDGAPSHASEGQATSVPDAGPPGGDPAEIAPGSLVEAGIDAYYDAAFDSAGTLLRLAADRARADDDAANEARAGIWLAQVARQRGELTEARHRAERALERVLESGLTELEPRAYSTLGFVAWYQNRLGEAARLFERSLERARELGDEEGISRAANNMAQIYKEWGDFGRAREGFEITLEAGRALDRPYHQAIALVNLGMLDIELGDALSAVPKLEEARRLFVENGYEDWEEYPLSHLGVAYLQLGDLRRARAKLDSALAIARAHGLASEEAQELRILAELHRTAGDYRRALQLYAEAARIETELGGVLASGTDLRSVAEIHAAVGDLAAAAARASEALRRHVEAGARHEELLDRVVLAEIAALRERPEEAARHLEAGRALAGSLGTRAGRVQLGLAEARIADLSRDSRTVLRTLDRIASDLSRSGFAAEWEAARLEARAHLREGRLESALDAASRAVATVEGVRETLGPGVLRSTFAAARVDTYADLVRVLLRLGRTGEAFRETDAARGGGMRDHLSAVGLSVRALDATASSTVRAGELLRRIDRLVVALDSLEATPSDERDDALEATARDLAERLARARREYEDRIARAGTFGRPAALLGTVAVTAEEVQRALRPGEVLIEYLVASDHVVAFALTRDRLQVVESTMSGGDLASRVRLALSLLRRPEAASGPSAVEVLERLHAILLDPLARTGALAGADRIVVVPHGVLAYLPFAALRDPVTRRHLVEDYAILHAPSAGALAALRTAGAPEAAAASDGVQAFAPFPERLPATEREVRSLAELAGADVALGERAREPAVRRALVAGSTVHVAAHGVMNVRNPMFSRIELSGGRPDGRAVGSTDDGRLEVHEVLALSVRAPLVFLSGCETGLGAAWSTDLVPGEDYATLDRAFLYAGARNVVATLWRVEDEGAADFAAAFYRELASGDPVEALARAQRASLTRPEDGSPPFHWAAYRMSGAGR